ncbi:cell division control protein 6 [Natronococcus amylolyticus DSM 10524]|uniref:Cell division control protein 6 n=1 Tax=Natronococcus amylolyticus DSM 10524 TaxID=1227497 RepID=L9X170_9EURY|nr:hypothetical protein [Natronococcus amylolyticus]ELY55470.1 cell division control protein 6 [Natronococcus amylolyticus DSM 10524]
MNKYDDLFDETAPDESLFTDKGALDPLTDAREIVARDDQERELQVVEDDVRWGLSV